ncbi:hypothetical protein FACS189454_04330 [Planctomycetales bacterium]|nr:hypothetical protein FACS189454_04330 [Planctomycetales bacterium]
MVKMSKVEDTTQLNREIIARELFNANNYVLGGHKNLPGWENESEGYKRFYQREADYMLSKFRMILLEDDSEQTEDSSQD